MQELEEVANAIARENRREAMKTAICNYCNHSRKDHCRAGTIHSNYKDEMRMVRQPRTHACLSDHCNHPLCDCRQFEVAL